MTRPSYIATQLRFQAECSDKVSSRLHSTLFSCYLPRFGASTELARPDTMSNVGTVKHIPKDVRYAFLQQAAPASYVAGLGRG